MSRVADESMEALLRDGELILVDHQRRIHEPNCMYVLRTGDGLVVKRTGREGGGDLLQVSEHAAWEPVPWLNGADTEGQAVWTARSLA